LASIAPACAISRGARTTYERALRLYESVPRDDPAWQAYPRAKTLTLKRLGAVEMVTGGLDASERHYRAALAIEEDVIRRDPGNAQWPYEMSYTLSDLGLALQRRGQHDEAIAMWTRALALRQAAVAADPKNVRAIHALATILNRLGRAQRDAKRPADALTLMREELRWRDTLLTIQGPSPSRLKEQSFARLNLAGLLLDLAADGRAPAARGHADEARTLFRSVGRPADMASTSKADFNADYRQWYDIIAARVARR
jgi:tetratricopeptide (TPR) repeat protein